MEKADERSEGRRAYESSRAGAVLLVVVAAAAVIGAYAWYVVQRIDYFVERDLRGLSTLTSQVESELARQQEAVTIFAKASSNPERLVPRNGAPVPAIFTDFSVLEREIKTVDQGEPPAEIVTHDLVATGPQPSIVIRSVVLDPSNNRATRTATGIIDLDGIVRYYFSQPFLSIFDSVLLTTPDGKVLQSAVTTNPAPLRGYRTLPNGANGTASNGVIVTDLTGLEERDGLRSWKALNVAALQGASRRTDVRIMDDNYYLFTQPARFLTGDARAEPAARIGEPQKRETAPRGDLLVCALVPKRRFRLQALTVSDSAVAAGVGIVILILCCYPFLRLAELPKQAPLRPVDVVLAAIAALVGSGVISLMMSDMITYRRIRSIEDNQLEMYGRNLRRDLVRDILRSAIVAEAMRDWSSGEIRAECEPIDNLERRVDWTRKPIWQQPYFTGFVWADEKGQTIVNAATGGKAPPPMSIERRGYFRDVRDSRWWTVVEQGHGPHRVIVEISRSRGDPETTVAVPADPYVFAVGTPFIHFIDPVVPPGFGFAVIDDRGTVQFHSEKQRALNENLFKETDDNRHLRAAVYARQDAHVSARYWGVDHQLYVAPVPGTPWTVVAMRDESVLWTINSEVIAMTALLLSLYALLYAIGFVFLAALSPRYRVPWLWPDERREWFYWLAVVALCAEAIAFTACMLTLGSWEILYVGFLAPLRGLTTAFLVVNRQNGREAARAHPRLERSWKIGLAVWWGLTLLWIPIVGVGSLAPVVADRLIVLSVWLLKASLIASIFLPRFFLLLPSPQVENPHDAGRDRAFKAYKFAGAILVFLIAVLPSLSFLKISMRLEIETRIKYAQLRLADMLEGRLNLLERMNRRGWRIAYDCYEIPYVFQSGWTLVPPTKFNRPLEQSGSKELPRARNRVAAICTGEAVEKTWVPAFVQYLLPRYSESSIAMRDLHHDTASDRAWRWCRDPYELTLTKRLYLADETSKRLYGETRPAEIIIRSAVPTVMYQEQLFARAGRPGSSVVRLESLGCTPPASDSDADAVLAVEGLPVMPPDPRWLPVSRFAAIVMLVGLLVLIIWTPYQAVGFLGRRVFLYDVRAPKWIKYSWVRPDAGTSLFIHLSTKDPADIVDEERYKKLDMAKSWRELQIEAEKADPRRPLLISDFEDAFQNARLSGRVLSLLEVLLASRNRTIVVLSRISTAAVLATADDGTWDRWEAVFAEFAHLDEADVNADDRPGRYIPDGLTDENRFIFERIWSDSSAAEQLVLFQIARDGLVNGKEKDVLGRLLGRGLVLWSPELRLVTGGLEQFVIEKGKADNIAAEERLALPPRWQSLKVAIGVLAVAAVIVMLTTQKELINYTSAIITAIAAAVPALLRLIAVLDGRQSGEAG